MLPIVFVHHDLAFAVFLPASELHRIPEAPVQVDHEPSRSKPRDSNECSGVGALLELIVARYEVAANNERHEADDEQEVDRYYRRENFVVQNSHSCWLGYRWFMLPVDDFEGRWIRFPIVWSVSR